MPPNAAPTVERPPILVVEDEPAIADTILYALRTEGFDPDWATTVGAARESLGRRSYALAVLDIGLPDGSGFDFCRELRARDGLPVIFLTARSEEIDRVVGLEIGADDYIVKPFSPRELTARVRAVLRRTQAPARPATELGRHDAPVPAGDPAPRTGSTRGPFLIDEDRCEVRYHTTRLDLTRREYRLLLALLAQPGRVFSREQLLTRAWDEPEASLDRTVDAHIKTLRAKLRAVDATTDPIRTHRGFGYSIELG
ncbi:MAG: two-component system response regulator CreB [Opitutaceae bacterium]|nr:two-component system response regulator CreB [Opitutaceae bacterium]